jgi:phosphoserine phosphatase
MRNPSTRLQLCVRAAIAMSILLGGVVNANARDPLPSWNDGPAKQAILAFVKATTEKSSPKYVEPNDRIATFDQDGTLWTEHPLYGQAMFALDRLGKMAPKHPEWKEKDPFKSVLAGDREAMSKFTESDWMEILGVTHAGMSTEEFVALVREWITTAKAPRFNRLYTDLVYQPMLEVMRYLRENGFRTYIVTGGGQEFVRVYSEQVYGVPPEQVVGSSIVTTYKDEGDKPVLMREPKVFLIDDGPGKAVGINLFIGKRPQAAFGNSGGD